MFLRQIPFSRTTNSRKTFVCHQNGPLQASRWKLFPSIPRPRKLDGNNFNKAIVSRQFPSFKLIRGYGVTYNMPGAQYQLKLKAQTRQRPFSKRCGRKEISHDKVGMGRKIIDLFFSPPTYSTVESDYFKASNYDIHFIAPMKPRVHVESSTVWPEVWSSNGPNRERYLAPSPEQIDMGKEKSVHNSKKRGKEGFKSSQLSFFSSSQNKKPSHLGNRNFRWTRAFARADFADCSKETKFNYLPLHPIWIEKLETMASDGTGDNQDRHQNRMPFNFWFQFYCFASQNDCPVACLRT